MHYISIIAPSKNAFQKKYFNITPLKKYSNITPQKISQNYSLKKCISKLLPQTMYFKIATN